MYRQHMFHRWTEHETDKTEQDKFKQAAVSVSVCFQRNLTFDVFLVFHRFKTRALIKALSREKAF